MPSLNQFETKEQYNTWMRIYRRLNAEKIREYNRKYNSEWRKKNGYHSEVKAKIKFPEKEKARRKLQNSVKSGKILRGSCEVCGKPNSQGHHRDYQKPLEVQWLCPLHHAEQHKDMQKTKSISDEEIKRIIEKRKKALQLRLEKVNNRRKEIAGLHPKLTMREIAKIYGVTFQRVQQIISQYKKLNVKK